MVVVVIHRKPHVARNFLERWKLLVVGSTHAKQIGTWRRGYEAGRPVTDEISIESGAMR